MIQTNLHKSELAYLLHILEASSLVGADNPSLFPIDESIRQEQLDVGFDLLVTNGWIQQQDDQYNTNTAIVLLVAAMIAPEITLMVRHRVPDRGEQVVTYYVTQNYFVEQYQIAEDQYRLTQLDSRKAITDRMQNALGFDRLPEAVNVAWVLDSDRFTEAIERSKKGDFAVLDGILSVNGTPEKKLDVTAKQIAELNPSAKVEISSIAGDRILAYSAIILLRNESLAMTLTDAPNGKELILTVVDEKSFAEMINEKLDEMTLSLQSRIVG